MPFYVHVDRPKGFLINNLSQEFTGWLAVDRPANPATLQITIGGVAVDAALYPRPDVEQALQGQAAVGWTFHLDRRTLMNRSQRTIELVLRHERTVCRRHFFKSKALMTADNGSPMFFMHIPKTAGTALRQYTDFAFSDFPSLAIYGDYPGVLTSDAMRHIEFTRSRELIFGHFGFDFTKDIAGDNPKVITVFRDPAEMIRSYLKFNASPDMEFLDNPLVRHVSGVGYAPPPGTIGPEHLDAALRIAERHLYVIANNKLQAFADQVSDAFAVPRFEIPQINTNTTASVSPNANLPFDVRYDRQLYDACLARADDFIDFVNR